MVLKKYSIIDIEQIINESKYRTGRLMDYRHTFEDEQGNECDLTDITYEVLKTYVEPAVEIPNCIVFTHVIRIRPESLDLEMRIMELERQGREQSGD